MHENGANCSIKTLDGAEAATIASLQESNHQIGDLKSGSNWRKLGGDFRQNDESPKATVQGDSPILGEFN